MKKTGLRCFALLLAAAVVFAFAGCGATPEGSSDPVSSSLSQPESSQPEAVSSDSDVASSEQSQPESSEPETVSSEPPQTESSQAPSSQEVSSAAVSSDSTSSKEGQEINTDYIIKIFENEVDWSKVEAVKLQYFWNCKFQPETYAQFAYVEDEYFIVKMHSYEENPRATLFNPNDPVCTDSCMEMFMNFMPQSDRGYINVEMNPNGTVLCSIGEGRRGRINLVDLGYTHLVAGARQYDDAGRNVWEVICKVPVSLLKQIYGENVSFESGTQIKGNFYKCGDNTPIAHYGSWKQVKTKNPDFHQPSYFGTLTIE